MPPLRRARGAYNTNETQIMHTHVYTTHTHTHTHTHTISLHLFLFYLFFVYLCAMFSCFQTTDCEAYSLRRQMGMGSLTCAAEMCVRAVHTKWGSGTDTVCRRGDTEGQGNCCPHSACPGRGSNPGSWDLNPDSLNH